MININKKITIHNEKYQVVEDDNGELTLYKINSKGQKEVATLDFETFIQVITKLSKTRQRSFNKLNGLNVIGVLLAISMLVPWWVAISKELRKCVNSNICSTDDKYHFVEIINDNKNISDDLKPFLYYFAERTHEVFPEYDNICDNLDNVEFVSNDDCFSNRSNSIIAYYTPISNRVTAREEIPLYNYVNHELLHSWSVKFSTSCKEYQRIITEVITAQLEWELFGTKSYVNYTQYAKMLALIIGGDKLVDIYANGEFSDLESELTKYCSKEELDETLMLLTSLKEEKADPSDERYTSINNFFIDIFFEKLNQDINRKCTISQAEYSTLIEDVLKFKKIYLGFEDNSYFNEQLDKFGVNISSKFEAISDYETSKKIISKRWYYAELTEDQISYISGVLTYHYEIKLYGDSPENEYAMLYEIPGANNEYIETFPNNVPEDSVATVKTSSNNQIGFYNVDYYTNATNLYSSINGAPFPQYSFNSNNFNQEKGYVLTKKYKND